MKANQLSFMIEEIIKYFEQWELALPTIAVYRQAFERIKRFFLKHGSNCYSLKILDKFRKQVLDLKVTRKHKTFLLRTTNLIKEYATTGHLVWHYSKKKSPFQLKPYFQSIIDTFLSQKEVNKKALYNYSSVVQRFCVKLEHLGIQTFDQITVEIVVEVISFFRKTNAGSMDKVIRSLKEFFYFLNFQGLSTIIFPTSLFRSMRNKKIIPCFSRSEIQSVLECCDKNTEFGIRSYAIILLAVTTGLRCSDIMNLRLQSINWHKYEIHVFQQKTNRFVVLPLLPETGNAIGEYILKARNKNSVFNNVFLKIHAPERPITKTTCDDTLEAMCKKASVKKLKGRSFHSLRRSTGTWMANSGVQVSTIAQVLGHKGIQSVDRYISADPKMANCSLGFEGLPLSSEVYQ